MDAFDREISIGIVFDISLSHENGVRIIDLVKGSLVKMATDLGMSGKLYIAHPDNKVSRTQGQGVYQISSYDEPSKFDVEKLFKQTVYAIGNQEGEKYILVLTDRFQAKVKYKYQKGLMTNRSKGFKNCIYFIGIGKEYDQICLNTVAEYGATFIHLDSANQLNSELKKIIRR